MEKDTCILVSSCDSYQDVLQVLFASINEYWTNCRFSINVLTESSTVKSPFFKLYNINPPAAKASSWGSRMIYALQQMSEEFVVVIYDDYVLESTLDYAGLDFIIEAMRKNSSVACCYLKWLDFRVSKDNEIGLWRLNKNNFYQVNSGPAVWRRKLLINLLHERDNPWAWEFYAMFRSQARKLIFCSVGSLETEVYNYANKRGGAVYRGKWVEDVAVPKILKYSLPIDVNVRGVLRKSDLRPRTFAWKINFFLEGLKMVGLRAFILFPYYVAAKLKNKYES